MNPNYTKENNDLIERVYPSFSEKRRSLRDEWNKPKNAALDWDDYLLRNAMIKSNTKN